MGSRKDEEARCSGVLPVGGEGGVVRFGRKFGGESRLKGLL